MKLYYFEILLDYDTFSVLDNDLRYEFQCRVDFINHYLTKAVRCKKIDVGNCNGLYITLLPGGETKQPKQVDKDLRIYLPFHIEDYQKAKQNNDISYYLDIIRRGMYKFSEIQNVPVTGMLDIVDEFEKNNYQNKWLLKRRTFREVGLTLELHCELTTDYYQVTTIVKDLKKNILCQGLVLKTLSCMYVYTGLVKDIVLVGNSIFIIDKNDYRRIKFNIPQIRNL
ncbi:MAG: hypothetical protein Q4E41_01875 [Bacteroidales bacterium]|nr:hypothetical protein [Bacteroidales bacterium]